MQPVSKHLSKLLETLIALSTHQKNYLLTFKALMAGNWCEPYMAQYLSNLIAIMFIRM